MYKHNLEGSIFFCQWDLSVGMSRQPVEGKEGKTKGECLTKQEKNEFYPPFFHIKRFFEFISCEFDSI